MVLGWFGFEAMENSRFGGCLVLMVWMVWMDLGAAWLLCFGWFGWLVLRAVWLVGWLVWSLQVVLT